MSDAPQARRLVYLLILIVALLETAVYAFFLKACWFSQHQPATRTFDITAGLIVSFVFCVTTIPASILALMRAAPRAALLFVLSFPAALALLAGLALVFFAWA